MAANPMQKKARNAFLLGVVVMLIISLVIGALIFIIVFGDQLKNKDEEDPRGVEVMAFALNQSVKSGQVITGDMLTPITVWSTTVPSNYVDPGLLGIFEFMDREGNAIQVEIDDDGEQVMYIEDGNRQIIVKEDADGYYKVLSGDNKEYIDLLKVPVIAKIDINANALLTSSAITRSNQRTTDDLRFIELNMVTLQTMLEIGDYIDLRIMMPSGQDFIVISKKEIMNMTGDTIGLYLTEDEILMMNCAIVENYIITASILYAVKYVDPGIQQDAIPTYPVNAEVYDLILKNPNIVIEAKNAISIRQANKDQHPNGNELNSLRERYINTELDRYGDKAESNLEGGIQRQKQDAQEARRQYLSSLEEY